MQTFLLSDFNFSSCKATCCERKVLKGKMEIDRRIIHSLTFVWCSPSLARVYWSVWHPWPLGPTGNRFWRPQCDKCGSNWQSTVRHRPFSKNWVAENGEVGHVSPLQEIGITQEIGREKSEKNWPIFSKPQINFSETPLHSSMRFLNAFLKGDFRKRTTDLVGRGGREVGCSKMLKNCTLFCN